MFDRIFNALSDDPDMEVAMIDGTIVKVTRARSSSGDRQIERRMDAKLLALTDALGNLVRFILLPGNRYARLAWHR